MYYSTFDPYNETCSIKQTCMICWESDDMSIEFGSIYKNTRKCKCKGYSHPSCIKVWISKNNSCPVCRSKVYKNITCVDYYMKIKDNLWKNIPSRPKYTLFIIKIIYISFLLNFIVYKIK